MSVLRSTLVFIKTAGCATLLAMASRNDRVHGPIGVRLQGQSKVEASCVQLGRLIAIGCYMLMRDYALNICDTLGAFMAVCMYVCMYVCRYACMHACMRACTYVCMYVCMFVCL